MRAAIAALVSAALFGASTPFAKQFLASAHPVVVAGLLYFGSGVGLLALWLVRGGARTGSGLALTDGTGLGLAILLGGAVAPVLLMLGLQRTRAQAEHAMAVLLGMAPAQFKLETVGDKWTPAVPVIPLTVPSELLQRRPDIAGAERRVAQANEQIGIAQAAFYPSLGLSASYGISGGAVADLFSAAPTAWSLGLSLVQTVFNAGLTRGRVDAARAGWEQTVANYRQTVLTAFQDVEDQLSATRILGQQLEQRRISSNSATQAETQFLNRYQAGQVAFTEVVTAQVSALNARRSLVQAQADQMATAVALTQALGGGWTPAP